MLTVASGRFLVSPEPRVYRVSQVPIVSLQYHTVASDPERAMLSYHIDNTHLAFQQMETVGLFDFMYYGAQYLHFRYGLISPSSWLHSLHYFNKCNFQ